MLVVAFDPRALREFNRIPAKERARLLEKIESFATRPDGQHSWAMALTGRPGFRLRQGDYRVLIAVDRDAESLTVLRAGHRREVYR